MGCCTSPSTCCGAPWTPRSRPTSPTPSRGRSSATWGPVFLVLKGREAALSMRELIDKLTPVIDELYPDLDAELWRQHREILRQATLDSHSRARVNGTQPAAVIAARQAAYYITT